MKILWIEKYPFDYIRWSLVIIGKRFVWIDRKKFHTDGARYSGFKFVKFNFEILFILFYCCAKIGADFVVVDYFIEEVFISL